MKIAAIVVTLLVLTACGEKTNYQPQPIEPSPAPVAAVPIKPPFTDEKWRTSFNSVYEIRDRKSSDDGTSEYLACFGKIDGKKCEHVFFGKRDGFRKLDHLTPAATQLNNIADIYTNIQIYVAAKECARPHMLVTPTINQKDWLFMEKVAFMADGNVVLEKSFVHDQVKREVNNLRIHERATFVTDEKDISALTNFASSEKKIIRITGQKGYVTIDKQLTKQFTEDLNTTLEGLRRLNGALEEAGGPTCT